MIPIFKIKNLLIITNDINMNQIFNQNIFLVKEQIGLFKAANNFDIFNPENNELVLTCREPNLGFFCKTISFYRLQKNDAI